MTGNIEIDKLNAEFRPRYRYPFWVNGVPATVKYFSDIMECLYKRNQEKADCDLQAQCMQEQLTEHR